MLNFLLLLLAGFIVSILLLYYERKKRKKYYGVKFNLSHIYVNMMENKICNISFDDFIWAWKKIANTLHIEMDYLDSTKTISEYATHLPFLINSDMEEIERMLNKIAIHKELGVDNSGFFKDFTIVELVCLVAQNKEILT